MFPLYAQQNRVILCTQKALAEDGSHFPMKKYMQASVVCHWHSTGKGEGGICNFYLIETILTCLLRRKFHFIQWGYCQERFHRMAVKETSRRHSENLLLQPFTPFFSSAYTARQIDWFVHLWPFLSLCTWRSTTPQMSPNKPLDSHFLP